MSTETEPRTPPAEGERGAEQETPRQWWWSRFMRRRVKPDPLDTEADLDDPALERNDHEPADTDHELLDGEVIEDEPAPRKWRFGRRRRSDGEIFGELMVTASGAISAVPVPRATTEVATRNETAPARTGAQAWADRVTAGLVVPHPGKVAAQAKYWGWKLPQLLVVAGPKFVAMLLREVRPVARGCGRFYESYLQWVLCPSLAEAVKAAEAAGTKTRLQEKYHSAKSRRFTISVFLVLGLAGGGVYAYFTNPWWLAGAGFFVVCVLDLIGRHGQAPQEFAPVKRQPLTEGMPLRQLTESILAVFGEEGLEVTAEGVIHWDYDRRQYRLGVSTYAEILPRHLRAIERGIGAPDDSIRMVRTGTATSREIIIQRGDPLASVSIAPFVPTGSLSVNNALVLGVSPTDYPFALHLAGVHLIVVGTTGAGKTSTHLNNIIDGLSAACDAVLYGIDLTRGPLFSMWRDVIQKKAYTPEEADSLLDLIIAEIDRRAQILDDIANDDDPTNDTSEWTTELGPALFVVVDEFPELAKFDGTPKGTLNLLEKVERIHRTGRKHLVSIIIGIQKMGNSDTGSTVVASQSGLVIVGPCTMADTVAVFGTDGRDYGYAPHQLKPGTKTEINDAGKCYVKAPGFGPDVVRGFAPLATAEIKRRARARMADGLPRLGEAADFEAAVIPPGLAAVDAALTAYSNADKVPSRLVIEWANLHTGANWTPTSLAEALRNEATEAGVMPPKARPARSEHSGNDNVNHYHRADINRVLRAL